MTKCAAHDETAIYSLADNSFDAMVIGRHAKGSKELTISLISDDMADYLDRNGFNPDYQTFKLENGWITEVKWIDEANKRFDL